MPISVGIDLVDVETILDAIARHGDRYLGRVYTTDELADCAGSAGVDAKRLAQRFAAKEATLKALRVAADVAVPWLEIELRRDPAGAPGLTLRGRAATLAEEAGAFALTLSVSESQGLATAIVVACLR